MKLIWIGVCTGFELEENGMAYLLRGNNQVGTYNLYVLVSEFPLYPFICVAQLSEISGKASYSTAQTYPEIKHCQVKLQKRISRCHLRLESEHHSGVGDLYII